MHNKKIQKIIYKSGDRIAKLEGEIFSEDKNFIRILSTENREFRLNKNIILEIKDPAKNIFKRADEELRGV